VHGVSSHFWHLCKVNWFYVHLILELSQGLSTTAQHLITLAMSLWHRPINYQVVFLPGFQRKQNARVWTMAGRLNNEVERQVDECTCNLIKKHSIGIASIDKDTALHCID